MNPEGAEDEGAGPDARTWRRVTLRMVNDAEGRVELRLLRPDAWFEENDVEVGGTVHLEMVELGAVGPAEVLEIGPCPPIQPGEGGVVTGTFASEHAGELAEIAARGRDEPIRCTPKHRFWSEERVGTARRSSPPRPSATAKPSISPTDVRSASPPKPSTPPPPPPSTT